MNTSYVKQPLKSGHMGPKERFQGDMERGPKERGSREIWRGVPAKYGEGFQGDMERGYNGEVSQGDVSSITHDNIYLCLTCCMHD